MGTLRRLPPGPAQASMGQRHCPKSVRAGEGPNHRTAGPESETGGATASADGSPNNRQTGLVTEVNGESREPLAILGAVRSGDSWMLPVVINEVPVLALVNTGASVTMIYVEQSMSP